VTPAESELPKFAETDSWSTVYECDHMIRHCKIRWRMASNFLLKAFESMRPDLYGATRLSRLSVVRKWMGRKATLGHTILIIYKPMHMRQTSGDMYDGYDT